MRARSPAHTDTERLASDRATTPAPTRPAGVRHVLNLPSPGYATVTAMRNIEFIPTRTSDGTIVLRAVGMGRGERLRRFARRLLRRD